MARKKKVQTPVASEEGSSDEVSIAQPAPRPRDKVTEKRKAIERGPWALDKTKFCQTFDEKAYDKRSFLDELLRLSKYKPDLTEAMPLLRKAQSDYWVEKRHLQRAGDSWNCPIVTNVLNALLHQRTGAGLPDSHREDQRTSRNRSISNAQLLNTQPANSQEERPESEPIEGEAHAANRSDQDAIRLPLDMMYDLGPDTFIADQDGEETLKALVNYIEHPIRQHEAASLVQLFFHEIEAIVATGIITLPDEWTTEQYGRMLGLGVEHRFFVNFWGSNSDESPPSNYIDGIDFVHSTIPKNHRFWQICAQRFSKEIGASTFQKRLLEDILHYESKGEKKDQPVQVTDKGPVKKSRPVAGPANGGPKRGVPSSGLKKRQKRPALIDNDTEMSETGPPPAEHEPMSSEQRQPSAAGHRTSSAGLQPPLDEHRPLPDDHRPPSTEQHLVSARLLSIEAMTAAAKKSHSKNPAKIYGYVPEVTSNEQAKDNLERTRGQTKKRGRSPHADPAEDKPEDAIENMGGQKKKQATAQTKKRGKKLHIDPAEDEADDNIEDLGGQKGKQAKSNSKKGGRSSHDDTAEDKTDDDIGVVGGRKKQTRGQTKGRGSSPCENSTEDKTDDDIGGVGGRKKQTRGQTKKRRRSTHEDPAEDKTDDEIGDGRGQKRKRAGGPSKNPINEKRKRNASKKQSVGGRSKVRCDDKHRIERLQVKFVGYVEPRPEDVAVQYLDTCLLLPKDAPLGWPHLVDVTQLSAENHTGLTIADMVVTVLHMHSPETLASFMEMSHGFSYRNKKKETDACQNFLIVRVTDTVTCGYEQYGNWSVRYRYILRGTVMARWTPEYLEVSKGPNLREFDQWHDAVEIMSGGEGFAYEALRDKEWQPEEGSKIYVRNTPTWKGSKRHEGRSTCAEIETGRDS